MNFKFIIFVSVFVLLTGVVSASEAPHDGTFMVKESVSSMDSNSIDNDVIVKKSNEYTVKSTTSKVKTKLTVDRIPNVSKDSSVFVSGSLRDNDGNGIDNARVTLDINGDKYSTNTYDGYYFGEYFADTIGNHSVKVSFAGNSKYSASAATTSFLVSGKIGTYIMLNDVSDTKYGNKISISGYFRDNYGKYLKNSLLTVNVNDKKYSVKTDSSGYFVKNFKVVKIGKNSVKVSYKGNSKYTYASSSTSFKVSKQSTKITCNNLNAVNKGSNVKVSGYLVDTKGIALKSANVVVNVNGVKHNVKTKGNGYYSYSFKVSKLGRNSVSVSFAGSKYYLGKSVSKTFNVKSPYKTMTLYMDQIKYVGNDRFSAWYQTVNGEFNRGVYILVNNKILGIEGPADDTIISATFYFKNSKGKIISRNFDEGNGLWMKHELINGYTPFKVVAKYRRMSSYETHMWNSLYKWDAVSKTWTYFGD